MKMKWYLAAMLALLAIGHFGIEAPDNHALRVLFYVLAAYMAGYIFYHEYKRWQGEDPDGPPPKRAKDPPSALKEATWQPPEPKGTRYPPEKNAAASSPGVRGNPAVTKEIPERLVIQTLENILQETSPAVRSDITQRAQRAAKGDVDAMLAFGQGLMYGDAYLKRDVKMGIRWMGHAVAHGAADMLPILEWAQECDKQATLPRIARKPESYVSNVSAMDFLDSLIGLEKVKKQVKTFINRHNLEKLRHKNQLPSESSLNLNLVFTGNPGTGKTVVAQQLGNILAGAGLLKTGHMVEASGISLADRYVGGAAPKVEAAVRQALGGVLFIDEAYALISQVGQHGPQGSGAMEAITTLLTQMNQYKGKFMVIVAGYPDEMEAFLNFNPGLKSRFREILHFDNFSTDELVRIFMKHAEDRHYILTEGCRTVLEKIMHAAPGKYAKSFGNARFVGNLFEETLERVANRVAQAKDVTREDLMTITPFDINDAAEDFLRQHRR